MRDHHSSSSGSDNRLTLVLMLLSLVVICFVYSFVGRDHHSDHRQKQKEILYTIDTMLIPPKNATSGLEPTPLEKKKEPSLNSKMNQEDQYLLENYYSNGKKKIQKFSDKRLFQSLTEESLLEKYQKAAEKPNNNGCMNWGVVTTTKPPTPSIEKFLSFASKWCLVIVGDSNGPKTYLPDLPISRGNPSASSLLLENNSSPSLDINYIYLSLDDQLSSLSSAYSIISSLPLNHFSRKNIGYLYAIQHGASQMIYDFDDDYSLISMKKANNIFHNTFFQYHLPPVSSSSLSPENRRILNKRNERTGKKSMKNVRDKRRRLTESLEDLSSSSSSSAATASYYVNANELVNYNSTFLNVFPLLGSNIHPSWPRGFPINHLKESDTSSLHQTFNTDSTNSENGEGEERISIKFEKNEIKKENVGLIHYVANHFPDVDIIYKMTLTLPLDFPLKGHLPILLPSYSSTSKKQVYAPYNSKSTIFFSSLFWSLYLPLSVNNHLTDIFRAYITERIVFEINRRNSLTSRSINSTSSENTASSVASSSKFSQFRIIFHYPISIHAHRDLFNDNGDSKNTSTSSSSSSSSNADQQDILNINNLDFLRSYSKEYQLYLIVNIVVNELSQFRFNTKTIPGMLEEIYIYFYEIGLFQKTEVIAVQSWIKQLIGMKYRFPTVFSISKPVDKVNNSTENVLMKDIVPF
jgi:hypothetical protein